MEKLDKLTDALNRERDLRCELRDAQANVAWAKNELIRSIIPRYGVDRLVEAGVLSINRSALRQLLNIKEEPLPKQEKT
jgi:hypothetical protein